jgi:glycosyltransferase involved in cell wall biosynthesis
MPKIPFNPFSDKKFCIIIPTYNNSQTLENILLGVIEYTENVIVVNDGSTDKTLDILKKFPQLSVINQKKNFGKGYALRTGFKYAAERGFDYAITIDSDGQHLPDDIPEFLNAAKENENAIIIGSRNMEQEGVPRKSSFGHKFSNFWFRVETGIKLSDTQSGYRLYPLKQLQKIHFFTRKFEFEIEAIVRAAWRGIPVISVPVNVVYAPKETRVSHFRPIRDFTRISILNTFLVFIAIFWEKPFSFIRSLNRENIRKFFDNQLFNPAESRRTKVFSVMLGVFMGVSPFWGYQMALALFLAYVFKINKIITLIASNISIPPMIPFIIWASYAIGGLTLGDKATHLDLSNGINLEFVKINLLQYIIGSLCLGIILAVFFGIVTYLSLVFYKKIKTITE